MLNISKKTTRTDGHRMTAYTACIARAVKIAIFTYPGLHFLFALGTPLWQSRKTLHEWKDNSVLAKPLAACTIYLQEFPSYTMLKSMCKSKNRYFHVPQPTFLFPLETPLRLSCNMLHEWKEFNACQTPRSMYLSIFNSFRVIRCLSRCVSSKTAIFTTFRFPLGTPLRKSH